MNNTHEERTAFLDAFLVCALWASTDTYKGKESVPCDEIPGKGWAPTALLEAKNDCDAFIDANLSDLKRWEADQAGHDFFLTRNGHGTGFWDRGKDPEGKRLSDAAHVYGTLQPYLGDDAFFYFSH